MFLKPTNSDTENKVNKNFKTGLLTKFMCSGNWKRPYQNNTVKAECPAKNASFLEVLP